MAGFCVPAAVNAQNNVYDDYKALDSAVVIIGAEEFLCDVDTLNSPNGEYKAIYFTQGAEALIATVFRQYDPLEGYWFWTMVVMDKLATPIHGHWFVEEKRVTFKKK